MPRRKPNLVSINEAGFELDDKLRLWLSEKFPTIDPEETLELFTDKALAKGWMYADWPAAFRNYVRRDVKNQWGGVAYKAGFSDPKFGELIERARALGFRMPNPRTDTVASYRQALDAFDKTQASRSTRQLDLSGVVKRFGKE